MTKTKTITLAAAVLAAAFVTPALAAPPADAEACNKLAFDLADKAAKKKLPDAEAIKVDEMIGSLEKQCSDGKFADAETTAKTIDATLAK